MQAHTNCFTHKAVFTDNNIMAMPLSASLSWHQLVLLPILSNFCALGICFCYIEFVYLRSLALSDQTRLSWYYIADYQGCLRSVFLLCVSPGCCLAIYMLNSFLSCLCPWSCSFCLHASPSRSTLPHHARAHSEHAQQGHDWISGSHSIERLITYHGVLARFNYTENFDNNNNVGIMPTLHWTPRYYVPYFLKTLPHLESHHPWNVATGQRVDSIYTHAHMHDIYKYILTLLLKLCAQVCADLCRCCPWNLAALELLPHQTGLEIKSFHSENSRKYGKMSVQMRKHANFWQKASKTHLLPHFLIFSLCV